MFIELMALKLRFYLSDYYPFLIIVIILFLLSVLILFFDHKPLFIVLYLLIFSCSK